MYGFNLGQIEGLDSSVQTVTLTIANATESNTYTLPYSNTFAGWADSPSPETATVVLTSSYPNVSGFALIMFTYDTSDVGDEYTINIPRGEEPTQSFTNATMMTIEKSGYPLIEESILYSDTVTTVFDSQTSTYRATINELLGIASGLNSLSVIINGESASHYDEDDGYGYYEFPDATVGIKIKLATGRLIDLYSVEAGTYALSISAKVPNTTFISAVKSVLNIPTGDGEYILDITDGVISWKSNK